MLKTSAAGRSRPIRCAAPFALAALGALLATIALGQTAPDAASPAPSQTAAGSEQRLDVFDKTYPPNEPASGWISHKFSPFVGSGERYFFQFVHNGADEHYIHLRSGRNNSFSVGREELVSLKEWPVLEWEWKMTVLPKNGDVRVKARDDQAGSMCVVIRPTLTGFDSGLCYLFENDAPKDTPITSTSRDNARYLVLRTGKADPLGQWLHERRNALEDYKRVFGHEPSGEALVAMFINSNYTESSAEAFYRDIVLRKE